MLQILWKNISIHKRARMSESMQTQAVQIYVASWLVCISHVSWQYLLQVLLKDTSGELNKVTENTDS
jgi:hypothetical protein